MKRSKAFHQGVDWGVWKKYEWGKGFSWKTNG